MAEYDTAALAGLVGRAIARQRIRCGFTQEQIAERLGIGNEAVSRIERGLVMPNIERLLSLAEVFGCEAADLLTEASARPQDQARHLETRLATLNAEDRQLVMELLESLIQRLGRG
ncbi:helix-turn-helix domain-containing protein [Pseudomonas oryzihabitans]|uniref:helix-turn-helix domain-containing protein n=1 Tax=Pseudomonas oryzihabitans TaxID=47885 RepID=UPI0005A7170A|nr:helix-turn-helix transcriptional regulator [Pseudomonas oryzihabitans]NMZ46034.1 helix-turn-helix transcriptional regulator [Pseudomonas oryzihabitans]